jgi:3-deoxy-manno-octulosonate cytidylyltransferase (CMP-KDO synthetase)
MDKDMTVQRVTAIIPARLGSRRFSGKVLYQYRGKPLLYYVWKEASRSKLIDRLAIATDSSKIASVASSFGAEVVRTSKKHRTGSDRVAEAAGKIDGDIVMNIQGDNFGLRSAVLSAAIRKFRADRSDRFATLAHPIDTDTDLFDPNVVKVAVASDGYALWFSRFPIPYLQGVDGNCRARQFRFLKHIGVYFFRKTGLADYSAWKRGQFEKAESLEQLRIVENHGKIRVYRTQARTVSIDTPDDLKRIERL